MRGLFGSDTDGRCARCAYCESNIWSTEWMDVVIHSPKRWRCKCACGWNFGIARNTTKYMNQGQVKQGECHAQK